MKFSCLFGIHQWKNLAIRPLFDNEKDKRPTGLVHIRQCACCGKIGKQTIHF